MARNAAREFLTDRPPAPGPASRPRADSRCLIIRHSSFIILSCVLFLAVVTSASAFALELDPPRPIVASPTPQIPRVPKLVVESETFAFAECESGTKIDATFELRNEGDADLEIGDVKATCDCTHVRVDPPVIKPGGMALVTAKLDTSYRTGDLDKTIVVATNDPNRPEVTLHIKGPVYAPLTFKPGPLFFDDITPGRPAVADVTLTNTGKAPVTISAFTTSEPDLSVVVSGPGDAAVTLPHTLAVGEYVWLRLTLTTPADADSAGSLYRQIAVTVDPAPILPAVLKMQGNFVKGAGGTKDK